MTFSGWCRTAGAPTLNPEEPDYRITKAGMVIIGRTVMVVGGRHAAAIIPKLGIDADSDQQLLARVIVEALRRSGRESAMAVEAAPVWAAVAVTADTGTAEQRTALRAIRTEMTCRTFSNW
ncbi:hypothetical protein KACC15558_03160 [Brevibacterium ammoniilyticum]|uniref:Uncharacterized protein n=1 Tax=Brevibacterium ammoniilyticum TaxID=1046555 RepID=A0ABP9U2X8_9MICO